MVIANRANIAEMYDGSFGTTPLYSKIMDNESCNCPITLLSFGSLR